MDAAGQMPEPVEAACLSERHKDEGNALLHQAPAPFLPVLRTRKERKLFFGHLENIHERQRLAHHDDRLPRIIPETGAVVRIIGDDRAIGSCAADGREHTAAGRLRRQRHRAEMHHVCLSQKEILDLLLHKHGIRMGSPIKCEAPFPIRIDRDDGKARRVHGIDGKRRHVDAILFENVRQVTPEGIIPDLADKGRPRPEPGCRDRQIRRRAARICRIERHALCIHPGLREVDQYFSDG